ncbi:uncharacterized protein LOC129750942 [Uranotaenia lowii]|uniref:uncharacterized protein LOC129750942 n=1 Tax=Uranotaenia lowii TaxID=190385 RepID=UPI00247A95F1|nr:uncharacterized protein LOC129750942 [Uranotaenia lowii]
MAPPVLLKLPRGFSPGRASPKKLIPAKTSAVSDGPTRIEKPTEGLHHLQQKQQQQQQQQPSSIPRVDVVYLTYNAQRLQPAISLDNVCTVSLFELKKHRETKRTQKAEMSYDAYKHYQWYNSMLTNELRHQAEQNETNAANSNYPLLLKIFHWYIESANLDAFVVDHATTNPPKVYEAISLIIGAEVEHWYCAKAGHASIHGSRVRIRSTRWESTHAEQAKARITDCLVSPLSNGGDTTTNSSTNLSVPSQSSRLAACSKRLSLGTICEEMD